MTWHVVAMQTCVDIITWSRWPQRSAYAGPRPSNTQWRSAVPLNLNHIGQIALPVNDVDRAETFYENVIGLRKLYRFGDLSFFDCSGVRLLLERTNDPANFKAQGCI